MRTALRVFGCALTLFGAAASAEAGTMTCPGAPLSTLRDNQLEVTSDPTGICWDYGTLGDNGGQAQPAYVLGAGETPTNQNLLDNDLVELPDTDVEQLTLSDYLSGTPDSGVAGSFTVVQGNTGPLWLVLKFGSGNQDGDDPTKFNAPYWFAIMLPSIQAGDVIDWKLLPDGSQQALSNTRLFGNPENDEPDPAPEPTTMALLGIGLLAAGFARRRR